MCVCVCVCIEPVSYIHKREIILRYNFHNEFVAMISKVCIRVCWPSPSNQSFNRQIASY